MFTKWSCLLILILAAPLPLSAQTHPATTRTRASDGDNSPNADTEMPNLPRVADLALVKPDPAATQADAILKAFPGNAATLAARPDAKSFTVEGRVFEVQDDTKIAYSRQRIIYLVQKATAGKIDAHFTCTLDPKAVEDGQRVKAGQFIRLAGAIGKVTAAENRIELAGCHDIKLIGSIDLASKLAGRWSSAYVPMDKLAAHKALDAASKDAHESDLIDINHVYVEELYFKKDGTLTASLFSQSHQLAPRGDITGKWSVRTVNGKELLKIEAGKEPPIEAPVETDGMDGIRIQMPGFKDHFLLPEIQFSRLMGIPAEPDTKAQHAKAMAWLKTNSPIPQLLKDTEDFMRQQEASDDGYGIVLGPALTTSGKAMAAVGALGDFTTMNLTAEQAMFSDNKNLMLRIPLEVEGQPMQPEISVDAVYMQSKTDQGMQKVAGKITLHAIDRAARGSDYLVVMKTASAKSSITLRGYPSPDPITLDFAGSAPPSKIPQLALIFVERINPAREVLTVSKPFGIVLDPP